jgi:multidrug efflux pump subunit AcrA (membrane-fusion protein)
VDVFPVEATVDKADAANLALIRPGMTADVKIHVDTKGGVIALPIEAVVKEGPKSFVHRVLGVEKGQQRTEKVEVKTGARNDREIEIASGVKEGDQVLIKPASSSENEFKM